MLSAGSCVPTSGSFDFGSSLTAPGEFAVVDPPSQHELVLVLDVRVDEVEEDSALDAVVRLASGHRSARTADRDESAGESCCCRRALPGPRPADLVG